MRFCKEAYILKNFRRASRAYIPFSASGAARATLTDKSIWRSLSQGVTTSYQWVNGCEFVSFLVNLSEAHFRARMERAGNTDDQPEQEQVAGVS